MTAEEINALVVLLQKTPLTPAEALWIQGIIARLRDELPKTA